MTDPTAAQRAPHSDDALLANTSPPLTPYGCCSHRALGRRHEFADGACIHCRKQQPNWSFNQPQKRQKKARRLTPLMRQALERAHADGELRRIHDHNPGKPTWPCSPNTLRALVDRGLLDNSQRKNRHHQLMDVWAITDAGRTILNPPLRVVRDTVHSLRVQGAAQTRVLEGGVWVDRAMPEPEPIDPRLVDTPSRRQKVQEQHDQAKGAKAIANELAASLKAA